MAVGNVRVRVFTSRGSLPVENATVTIEQLANDGKRTLLSVQRTDESGLIQPVEVQTPELTTSQGPDRGKSWTDVQIRASHPMFASIVVEEAQVFPGITTEQEMELIPLPQWTEEPAATETFIVPPQSL